MKDKVIITIEDIRACGGCARSLRAFFKRYNLDLKAFIKDGGIDADKLRACNNAIADRVIAYKEKKIRESGQ